MILSFRTDMPGQTVQTHTVCHSVCFVWTHYSMVEPYSSNFRVIRTNFLGVRIFRKITVMPELKDSCDSPKFHICECIFFFLFIYFVFFIFIFFTAHQDYFTHFEPSQSLDLNWCENGRSPWKTAWLPTSRTWLASHVNKTNNWWTKSYVSPVKRICVFEHSVMTNFNCACPAIQRGQGSGLLSEGSSWFTACMSEQWRFWRDCADAQARLNLRCSHRR